jgi:hypothetical protein
MWNRSLVLTVLGAIAVFSGYGASAADIVVGGVQSWNMGLKYDQVNASVGDVLVS